jgi:hypothetical protein
MRRAAELFAIDEWGSDSRFVEKAWTSRSEPEPAFISVAVSRWHIVVTTRRDVAQLTVRGPETAATRHPDPRRCRVLRNRVPSRDVPAGHAACGPGRPGGDAARRDAQLGLVRGVPLGDPDARERRRVRQSSGPPRPDPA